MQVIDVRAWTTNQERALRATYFAALQQRVGAARDAGTVYPPEERTFFALTATPPERVRAVILGQDPYHEPGQAMGLAFSVPQGERLPPSLRNIFTELHTDLGLPQPFGGDLTPWAERGVLLLNTVLTVGRGAANSHAAWGWQRFTDAVLAAMAALPQPVAFVLWGSQAQKKRPLRCVWRRSRGCGRIWSPLPRRRRPPRMLRSPRRTAAGRRCAMSRRRTTRRTCLP